MKNRILACHLTYIIFRGLSHENRNLNFICHLMNIFIRCIFLLGKIAFDGHDTRRIFALRGAHFAFFTIMGKKLLLFLNSYPFIPCSSSSCWYSYSRARVLVCGACAPRLLGVQVFVLVFFVILCSWVGVCVIVVLHGLLSLL